MRPWKACAIALTLATGMGMATVVEAAPASPVPLAGEAAIQTVAFGCGRGFHPNPWGICRPNWGWGRPRLVGPAWSYPRPRPYDRPYGYYGPARFF